MSSPQQDSRVGITLPIGYFSSFLPACLGSLAAQSAPLEIAVFDASGDKRVAESIEASSLAIAHHHVGPDGGQTDAIQRGWTLSTAPILGWLNADDMLLEGCIDRVLAAFDANPDVDLVYGHSTICNADGVLMGRHSAVVPADDAIHRGNFISQPSCFIRRSAWERVGGLNTDLDYTMDWDLWWRLHEGGHKFLYLDALMSNVSWATGTKTSQVNLKRYREFVSILRRRLGWRDAANILLESHRHTKIVYSDETRWADMLPALHSPGANASGTAVTIPLLNARPSPMHVLTCVFSGSIEGLQIICPGAEITLSETQAVLRFDRAMRPGECAPLRISSQGPGGASLTRAEWSVPGKA